MLSLPGQQIRNVRRPTCVSHRGADTDTGQLNDAIEVILNAAADILGVKIMLDQPCMDAGLDSLGMTELRNMLSTKLNYALPGTLLFDYPCARELAGYICDFEGRFRLH
jgi:acyl carrier protein